MRVPYHLLGLPFGLFILMAPIWLAGTPMFDERPMEPLVIVATFLGLSVMLMALFIECRNGLIKQRTD